MDAGTPCWSDCRVAQTVASPIPTAYCTAAPRSIAAPTPIAAPRQTDRVAGADQLCAPAPP